MTEFQNLPSRIQDAVESQLTDNEHVRLCLLGRAGLLSPDFVIITSNRVLVLEERRMGTLNASYANIRCNLPFPEMRGIRLERHLKHRILGQACLAIEIDRNTYFIKNVNHREAKRAFQLISSQLEESSTVHPFKETQHD